MRYSLEQLAGSRPIFLLELDFMGKRWFFSTEPRTIEGIPYLGTLGDFDLEQSSQILGANIEANSLSLQVFFPGLNLLEEWRKGRTLEGMNGEFSYILEKNGQIITALENRIVLLDGIVQLPVIGDPLEPPGACSFTLERQPYETTREMIPGSHVIDKTSFSTHDQDTAGGKLYPIVFGAPGVSLDDDGNQVYLFCTPAYNIVRDPNKEALFLIAGHEVEAANVRIRDGANNEATVQVQKGYDSLGQVYSYVDVYSTALLFPGRSSISTNAQTPKEFWVCWLDGGGHSNPYGAGALEGGADICRWALTKAGIPVDYGAWDNIASLLNMYKFSGYINEPVKAWDWLKDNILPLLPIEITTGAKGVKPIMSQIYANTLTQPILRIRGGIGFTRTGALETKTETGEIKNSIQIQFGKQGQEDKYAMSVKLAPTVKEEGDAERSDLYSHISQNRYGLQEETIETNYIYSRPTAVRVAAHTVKSKAFPIRTLQFEASMEYGTLELGDVVLLSDDSLFIEDFTCTIISKSWNGIGWTIGLAMVENPILQERYI